MKLNIKTLKVCALAIGLLFSACVKEDAVFKEGGSNGVIQLNLATNQLTTPRVFPLASVAFLPQPSVDFPVTVQYLGTEGAPNDISVEMELDNSMVTRFNTVEHTSYTILDPSLYTVVSNVVTIRKGERSGTFLIRLKSDQFSFTSVYGLGIKIKSTSQGVVSGNYGAGVYRIIAANAWDGVYDISSGNIRRYTSPTQPELPSNPNYALNGDISGNADLTFTTASANSVIIGNLRWASGGGVGGIGDLLATINPTTNEVTLSSITGAGGAANLTLANIPNRINRYDPTTRTFTLNFDWNQTSNKREVTDLVVTYEGPRP
jgi:hypothetical protein